jgi:hypothetical protein
VKRRQPDRFGNLYAIAAAGRPDSGAVIAIVRDRNDGLNVTTR